MSILSSGQAEQDAVLTASKNLGFLDADLIVALPLSVSEKNIFFDRT